jgi:HlyD family secretion protein
MTSAHCHRLHPTVWTAVLLLVSCTPAADTGWSGYVEGETLYIAPALGGTLVSLHVRAGDEVTQGLPLFALESQSEQAARLEADARVAQAQAQVANNAKGKRPDEIAVIEAQLAQAQDQFKLATAALARDEPLRAQGFVSAARLEDEHTLLGMSRARVNELSAQLRVARLPARVDERVAAEAQAQATTQVREQSAWREAQKSRTAPASGRITDLFFRVGEWVQPGQPVLALLPPAQVKVRFFVPELTLGGLHTGAPVRIACDGCGAPIPAKISFIANRAEYTPPVIYSNAQRAKLVFMVEARPDPVDAPRLHPGQPVSVLPIDTVAR